MRDVVSRTVTPLLLGNNKCSRRLARRLFWRFAIRSNIFDSHRSHGLTFMLSTRFFPLPETEDGEFILLGLERFADEHEDNTCLLVPCSHEYVEFVKRNKHRLEERFIIRLPIEIEGSLNCGAEMPYERNV